MSEKVQRHKTKRDMDGRKRRGSREERKKLRMKLRKLLDDVKGRREYFKTKAI